eukprot:CAMPEP_0202713548 /NCGR_PEP_ID=MMETSP1385-20130828/55861_1 /ASSEMBLY_ACC=CAM_ASM_000861 /TAXON_ID=933848 /ORGANISM="Elphidium margaritaceum" /LENGTH=682 /DNA_ID=CAMNT_0049373931 /DNA_START=64 /DNA_END=2112 /DNA_ORIENTATION=+
MPTCLTTAWRQFYVLLSHGITTYRNTKLILSLLTKSNTIQHKTKRYLLKLLVLRVVVLIITVLGGIGISYPMNWYSTALNERNKDEFWNYLKLFVCCVCVYVPFVALDGYVGDLLAMRFRQTLTNMLFDVYMTKRAYYHIRFKSDIDNPGQRFGDDIKSFAYGVFDFLNVILKHTLNLLGFSYVLYTIDMSSIPYLIAFSLCGTIFALTVFSQRLTELSYVIMKDQADFVTNIIRIHDSAESIALYNAARHERNWLQMRLETLISDGLVNIRWLAALSAFSEVFRFLSIVFPYMLLAEKYFREEITMGQLSQSVYAFSALLRALNIIINNIPTLTSLSATSTRVGDAILAVHNIHYEHQCNMQQMKNGCHDDDVDDTLDTYTQEAASLLNRDNGTHNHMDAILKSKISTKETDSNVLKLENVSYFAPNSDFLLLHELNLHLQQSTTTSDRGLQSLLIVGYSGCGKSSLFRVISGLWNDGYGHISRPKLKHCLFLPQKPYLPNLPMEFNTLRNQLLFPKYVSSESTMMNDNITATLFHEDDPTANMNEEALSASLIDDQDILNVLEKINLTHLDTYGSDTQNKQALLYCTADWCNCLSVGEQQRLAIGRCLLSKPNMVFVDEATSALDEANECAMYEQLKALDAPIISIGHHKGLAKYHDLVLQFERNGKWKLLQAQQYLNEK